MAATGSDNPDDYYCEQWDGDECQKWALWGEEDNNVGFQADVSNTRGESWFDWLSPLNFFRHRTDVGEEVSPYMDTAIEFIPVVGTLDQATQSGGGLFDAAINSQIEDRRFLVGENLETAKDHGVEAGISAAMDVLPAGIGKVGGAAMRASGRVTTRAATAAAAEAVSVAAREEAAAIRATRIAAEAAEAGRAVRMAGVAERAAAEEAARASVRASEARAASRLASNRAASRIARQEESITQRNQSLWSSLRPTRTDVGLALGMSTATAAWSGGHGPEPSTVWDPRMRSSDPTQHSDPDPDPADTSPIAGTEDKKQPQLQTEANYPVASDPDEVSAATFVVPVVVLLVVYVLVSELT